MVELFANSGDPDQTLYATVSDLGLHCLSITHSGVPSLQWVNCNTHLNGIEPIDISV